LQEEVKLTIIGEFSRTGRTECLFEFDRQELLSAFASDDNIEIGNVCYKWIRELREELREVQIDFGQLPFLKRAQFKDEKELRIVYINIEEYVAYKEYPIKIEWIKRIALSPWMPKPLVGSVKDTLKSINEKCSDIQVTQSYLVDNETWQDLISTRAAPLLQSAVSDSLTPKKE
jgi:hypothetical protein